MRKHSKTFENTERHSGAVIDLHGVSSISIIRTALGPSYPAVNTVAVPRSVHTFLSSYRDVMYLVRIESRKMLNLCTE